MKLPVLILLMLASVGSSAQPPEKKLKIEQLTGDFYIYVTWQLYQNSYFPSNSL